MPAILESGSGNAQLVKVGTTGELYVTTEWRPMVGYYNAVSGLVPVTTAVDATAWAKFLLINPTGSGRTVVLRRATLQTIQVSTTLVSSVVRITAETSPVTGISSSTAITASKTDTTSTNPVATFHSTFVGSGVPTWGGDHFSLFTCGSAAAALTGVVEPTVNEWTSSLRGWSLDPGTMMGFRQTEAGVATETRQMVLSIEWQEY